MLRNGWLVPSTVKQSDKSINVTSHIINVSKYSIASSYVSPHIDKNQFVHPVFVY